MRFLSFFTLLLALAGALLTLTPTLTPTLTTPAHAQSDPDADYDHLNLFGSVLDRIQRDYVTEPDQNKLVEEAVRGMLQSLDPHSDYLGPDDFEKIQVESRGSFGGLGIEITSEDGIVTVVSPIDDTPAARAGIQAGDQIVAIDGEDIIGLSINEAVRRMRGEVNTPIDITVRRGDDSFDVRIVRDIIKVSAVRHRTEEDRYGYIRVTSFSEQATAGIREAVSQISAELGDDLRGYILDLRNNPGGLLDQAVSVSDLFLERGEIVTIRGRDESDAQRWNAEAGDITNGLPVVVMINSGSASASEIVAGALQDHARAVVIGTRSFGKGSVQQVVPLSENQAVRLTTALYYTPSGRSIQAEGIEPDVREPLARIAPLDFELSASVRREATLSGHIDNPDEEGDAETGASENTEAEENATTPNTASRPAQDERLIYLSAEDTIPDNQLARAIATLDIINVWANRNNGAE